MCAELLILYGMVWDGVCVCVIHVWMPAMTFATCSGVEPNADPRVGTKGLAVSKVNILLELMLPSVQKERYA